METINQTESDLENKIFKLSRIPNICRDCTKSALDAIVLMTFTKGCTLAL
jgi:hypothetical protein